MSSFEARIDRICTTYADAPRELILASRLLLRTSRLLRAHIERALAPFGLDLSQYLVISMLAADAGEPTMPSELGVAIDATRTQMTRLVDGLETRGLVQRHASTQDRRSLDLVLTPAGRRLLEQAMPAVHAAYGEAWEPLGSGGLDKATRALARLHANLEALEP
ncbi:MarR family transcriptional regulator [Cupriavidus sp. USMAA2-4]|uniref:MarR family transcriptional regulator n=1 Tax=Cupriavidus malaysiensis TaxID=367825 RepID=A0ABN4TM13_9BURK|nr:MULTISPECIES: MarR family transcriptional regulator [Cupriavidus]AOY95249.1 MarR family transcriptional regulator [Cupriavidus sp. USMAA2-4]AOZ01851.1 MarR family transcriptional regulator [Cupriavidus sp. USMAHM13]AOZ08412.1 MarR family transcriptional regulator [Cupriavidus malaysiensis]